MRQKKYLKKTAGLDLSASIDKNGNAIIESEGLNNGLCVKGVVCRPKEPKEMFVPKAGESVVPD
jgi:hypothetical protein